MQVTMFWDYNSRGFEGGAFREGNEEGLWQFSQGLAMPGAFCLVRL